VTERFIRPTQESREAFFTQEIQGEIMMSNLLRFRNIADYSVDPELAPSKDISGREAYQKYLTHATPFLIEHGGSPVF